MKVTIKTLQADSYQIDAEPTDTIRVIKSKIEESQGFSARLQKIIFSGLILKDDDRTLESYGFSEDKFLILMINQVCIASKGHSMVFFEQSSSAEKSKK
ncbi:ubiquitin-domain-containing protein [Dendrothele bispora CBS 962.96]|uniref:Ubiquitin-domain-containing protein n=1 Tax=Dendrothele bispora (strain CBS 962.96) TaxID=1314807 RepID=A0A4S8KJW2_DENBC|nr:ubiquitin-domain-containing protein [Dendrothele bispora CBS 962.96]